MKALLKLLLPCLVLVPASRALAYIPTSGLVACYPLDGDADDTVGGHDGTFYGDEHWTSGHTGLGMHAASFWGSADYIEIPDDDDFSITTTGALSISYWVMATTTTFSDTSGTGYVYVLGKGEPSSDYEWAARIYSDDNTEGRDNRQSCYIWDLDGSYGNGCYVDDSINTSQWMHFVIVYDIDNNVIRFYKNGSLRQSRPIDGSPYPVTNEGNGDAPLRFGTRTGPNTSDTAYFKGRLDNVCIYNRVLTQTDINYLYADTTL